MALQSPHDSLSQEELLSEGWKRRAMLSSERLVEVKDIYHELGLEILVRKPEIDQFKPECGACRSQACREYWVLFTRKKKS
ncbi:MAG: hypothetical protein QF752_01930 [Planctomycetota bacterium]|jgi:hypothetical protein|nr:hypothetical protein [Planctomycetota bacterium]